MSNENNSPSISYFTKKKNIVCPICDSDVAREELLTGGGRLLAGDLTKELHRLYEPSAKYGKVYPLIYSFTVCPNCYFSALTADFANVLAFPATIREIKNSLPTIKDTVFDLLGEMDYSSHRTLKEGIGSYLIATQVYELFPPELSPTLKMGISCLRSAWLCYHADVDYPNENYEYLSRIMYRKAGFFYRKAIEMEEEGKEFFTKTYFHYGPDQDYNFGYDGVLYLAGYLEFVYGSKLKPKVRYRTLESSKRFISKLVGIGKVSRSKTSAIIDHARDLYMEIKGESENRFGKKVDL